MIRAGFAVLVYTFVALLCAVANAQERSIRSPITHVNAEKGWLTLDADGKIFTVEASEAARPHLFKLPHAGTIEAGSSMGRRANERLRAYLASSFIARSRPFRVVGYIRPFISSLITPIDWR